MGDDSQPRSNSAWRVALRMALLLLGGTVVSVLVAWSCALFSVQRNTLWTRNFLQSSSDIRDEPDHAAWFRPVHLLAPGTTYGRKGGAYWQAIRDVGLMRVGSLKIPEHSPARTWQESPPPEWARLTNLDSQPWGTQVSLVEMGAGLPFACLAMELQDPGGVRMKMVDGVRLGDPAGPAWRTTLFWSASRTEGWVPLRVCWLGLTLDAIVWAVVLFGLGKARRAARRITSLIRRQELRCVSCNHPASDLSQSICPECGGQMRAPVNALGIERLERRYGALILATSAFVIAWLALSMRWSWFVDLVVALLPAAIAGGVLLGRRRLALWTGAALWIVWCVSVAVAEVEVGAMQWALQAVFLGLVVPTPFLWVVRASRSDRDRIAKCAALVTVGIVSLLAAMTVAWPPAGPSIVTTSSFHASRMLPAWIAMIAVVMGLATWGIVRRTR